MTQKARRKRTAPATKPKWDASPRLIAADSILSRSATAEARAGELGGGSHVSVELSIAYSKNDQEKGNAGVRFDVRISKRARSGAGGEPVFRTEKEGFGDFLDVYDLEPFALALAEAVRLAKLNGVIQPWMLAE